MTSARIYCRLNLPFYWIFPIDIANTVFLCRNLAFITLFWFEQEWNLPVNNLMNLLIVIATMAAAELASQTQGTYRSGFSRELDVPEVVKYFFSLAQHGATSYCIVGHRQYTMHFLMMLVIQGE